MEITHTISQKLANDFHTSNAFAESNSLELFADENTEVIIRVVGNFGNVVAAWRGTISGYLEPL
jgi:hypothetical protein